MCCFSQESPSAQGPLGGAQSTDMEMVVMAPVAEGQEQSMAISPPAATAAVSTTPPPPAAPGHQEQQQERPPPVSQML